MVVIEKTFSVTPLGVGLPDYSINVEYGTSDLIRSDQGRVMYSAAYTGVPTLPFFNIYGVALAGLVPASALPFHFYEIQFATLINALVYGGFARYDESGVVLEQIMAQKFGYGVVKLKFTKGIPTIEGKYYYILFAVFSGNPTFDLNVNLAGLVETSGY